ncbi:MAG: hypothetical protein AB7Q45_04855 [Planctomycetaceae bacterium]
MHGITSPGRYDSPVTTAEHARRLLQTAMPDAVELPPAVTASPYPNPPPGCRKWYQLHPPEPGVGHVRPHFKYADWTQGKKGAGGKWGHIDIESR